MNTGVGTDDPVRELRIHTLVVLCLGLFALSAGWGGSFWLDGHVVLSAPYFSVSVLALATLLHFWFSGNLEWASNYMLLLALVSASYANYWSGGLDRANVSAFMMVAVVSIFLLGRKGKTIAVVSVGIAGVFEALHAVGYIYPNFVAPDERHADALFTWVACASVVVVTMASYESARLRAMAHLHASNELLRRSEEQHRLVVEHANDGILVVADGFSLFANQRLLEIVGVDDEDLLAGAVPWLFDGSVASDGGSVRVSVEVDSVERWVDVTGVQVDWRGSDAMLIFLADITDRVSAEEGLARSQEVLRQAQKMEAVGQLAGGVAHDFNNLLTTIKLAADCIYRALPDDDPNREDVEDILDSSRRATTLTRQLLLFSRRQAHQPKVLDTNEVVESLTRMLRRLVGENITFSTLPAAILPPIKVDPGQLQQVVTNLVVNARDVQVDGGSIRVSTAQVFFDQPRSCRGLPMAAGRYVRLTVEDAGPGVSDSAMEHMFEPFFTTRDEGTGLGLAVVYGAIKKHGGGIEVGKSELGGARFDVFLPVVEGPAQVVEELQVSQVPHALGERVLLVEDEPELLRHAARILRSHGYVVSAARTVGDALEELTRSEPYALLVSDVVLPDGNGVDLAERVSCPVLLCSGYTGDRARLDRIESSDWHFLAKPYSSAELLQCARAALRAGEENSGLHSVATLSPPQRGASAP